MFILIWSIGALFTIGVIAVDDGTIFAYGRARVALVFAALIIWPVLLGARAARK